MAKLRKKKQYIILYLLSIAILILSINIKVRAEGTGRTEQFPGLVFKQADNDVSDILTGGQTSKVYLGEYEQDGVDNGKEAICWRVLSNEGGILLLLSDKNIDTMQYNEQDANVCWENCTLRNWLVNDFYSGVFTDAERESIVITENQPSNNVTYGVESERKTIDTVFLLSLEDIENEEYGFIDDRSRMVTNTTYTGDRGATGKAGGDGFWWLRTPGRTASDALVVYFDGYYTDYGYPVNFVSIGIRPALYLDSTNMIMLLSEETEDLFRYLQKYTGQFEKVDECEEKEYIPVIYDDRIELGIEGAEPLKIEAGKIENLNYSYEIKTSEEFEAENMYLCGVVERIDQENVCYYSCLQQIEDSEDWNNEIEIDLPEELEQGDYVLHLFVQQDGDDRKTKYGSNVINVPFSIVEDMQTDKNEFFEQYKTSAFDGETELENKGSRTELEQTTMTQFVAYILLVIIAGVLLAVCIYCLRLWLGKNRRNSNK